MREHWRKVRLGDVTRQVQDAVIVEPGASYPLLGVRWYAEGPFLRETATTETAKVKRLFRVAAGQFIYNRMFAWKGSFGVVPAELDGCFVSNEFPLFECDESVLLSDYLGLWFRQPRVWDEVAEVSTGTTASRNRWKESQFDTYQLSLPPLRMQRRIVDLMAHLDTHLANLKAEKEVMELLLFRTAVERIALPAGKGVPICDLLLRSIGGLWGDSPGTGAMTVDVYRSTEFTNLGYLAGAAEARRDISESQYENRALEPGDILVEKSGGTPSRPVGRVVRVTDQDVISSAIGANFLQILRADRTAVSPDYLFWVLWASHRRGDAADFQQASTNIRNLRTKEYLARSIELPLRHEQETIASVLDALLATIRALHSELVRVERSRASLLSSLLAGATYIPESYDSLLPEVA